MGNPTRGMQLSQNGYWKILRKELHIVGTWNSSFGQAENDWKDALVGMQKGQVDLLPIITHMFSIDEYEKAFSLMHN